MTPTSSSINKVFKQQVGTIKRNLEPNIQDKNLRASLRMSSLDSGHIDAPTVPERVIDSPSHLEGYNRTSSGESLYRDSDKGE